MGMAASQARFLGLTARKTNTEYEGQQINQQRTVLGNQSANYYNQLLGMTVPVPPSVSDFTKTTYTFLDGALTNSISSMIAQKDGTYLISYTASWQNEFAIVSTAPSIYTREGKEGNYTYRVGAVALRTLGEEVKDFDEQGNYTGNDPYLKAMSPMSQGERDALANEEKQYISELNEKYGTPENGWLVRYVENTSTGTWSPRFVKKDDLEKETTVYDPDTGATLSAINTYTVGSQRETKEIKGVTARMEQDASGRIINITLQNEDGTESTYAVTTNTTTDQAKYDDAMNQYEYDKYQYDQTIQEINAKIEIVQAEDRNLELRLKQLDTEQDAIQTEMDAVQKVIEKNTESTFKTFG